MRGNEEWDAAFIFTTKLSGLLGGIYKEHDK